MTTKERLENLKAQIALLKEAEGKIRGVRQDLEGEARELVYSPDESLKRDETATGGREESQMRKEE